MNMKSENIPVVNYRGLKTVLRPVNVDRDLGEFVAMINNYKATRFTQIILPLTREQERRYLEGVSDDNTNVIFVVEDLETGGFIGAMGLHDINWTDRRATSGAILGKDKYWGKGYGSDAKMLLLYHAFYVLNLNRISSACIEFNERSAQYLCKTGYAQEGRSRQVYYREGKYWDQLIFGLLRQDFDLKWKTYSEQLPGGLPY